MTSVGVSEPDESRNRRALLRIAPEAVALKRAALLSLIAEAERTRTDALLIAKNERIVISSSHEAVREPIEIRSITKSIVSLIVGRLIADGAIESVDEPLSQWFPALRGRKRDIRLRHVLTHTTGLSPRGNVSDDWDADRFLRSSRLRSVPGARHAYSDAATELLADVVARASGTRLDELAARVLFRPLGIGACNWQRRQDGTPHAAFGLALAAEDLLRIGLTIAAGGEWRGERLIAREWLQRLRRPGSPSAPYYSLLWYLRGGSIRYRQVRSLRLQLEGKGYKAAVRLHDLDGRALDLGSYFNEARQRLTAAELEQLIGLHERGESPLEARLLGFRALYAHGWPGQQLVIFPRGQLVAVRLCANGRKDSHADHSFPHLTDMLEESCA